MTFVDLLQEKKPDVYRRLCACKNTKEDLPYLVNIYWLYMQSKGKDKEGYTKEDAVVYILEWLDCNNQWQLVDITKEEYDELKK